MTINKITAATFSLPWAQHRIFMIDLLDQQLFNIHNSPKYFSRGILRCFQDNKKIPFHRSLSGGWLDKIKLTAQNSKWKERVKNIWNVFPSTCPSTMSTQLRVQFPSRSGLTTHFRGVCESTQSLPRLRGHM